ncbi:MAG: hypothetical protein IJF09_09825, partial [Ruminiclostridium sp.]|nr:hypothetical protein [Ruminiclostridium sp.]
MREIYTDEKCPICGVAFKEADDVVVCPDCGAPYHRACYKEQGDCSYSDKHGGYSWKGDKQILMEHCENIHYAKMKKLTEKEEDDIDMSRKNSVEELREVMEKRLLQQQKDFP